MSMTDFPTVSKQHYEGLQANQKTKAEKEHEKFVDILRPFKLEVQQTK